MNRSACFPVKANDFHRKRRRGPNEGRNLAAAAAGGGGCIGCVRTGAATASVAGIARFAVGPGRLGAFSAATDVVLPALVLASGYFAILAHFALWKRLVAAAAAAAATAAVLCAVLAVNETDERNPLLRGDGVLVHITGGPLEH